MWKSDPGHGGARNVPFLAKAFLNGFTMICEQTITLPPFDADKKRKR